MTKLPDSFIEDYLGIGEALLDIAEFVDGLTTFSAIPTEDAGDGTVAGDMNATDWTGQPHTRGSSLVVRANEQLIVGHKGTAYQYVGSKPALFGIDSGNVSTNDQYIPIGTSDHGSLNNRDQPDQHPIAAITGLEDQMEVLDNHVEDQSIHGKYYEQADDPEDTNPERIGSMWYLAANFLRISTIAGWVDVLLKSVFDSHVDGTDDTLKHPAADILFDDTIVQHGFTEVQEVLDFYDEQIALRETAPTGATSGSFVIVNAADPLYSIDVPAGTGEIVDGYTDRKNPTREVIGWLPVTIDLTPYIVSHIGVVTINVAANPADLADSTVSVTQGIQPSSLNRTRVLLAYVFYHNGTIDTVLNSPIQANEVGNSLYDYVSYIPPSDRTNGLQTRAVTALPSIWMEQGQIFHIGSNVAQGDPTQPNILSFIQLGDGATLAPFEIHYASGANYALGATEIPSVYQPDPLVDAVLNLTGNKATIHYIYRTVGDIIILQLGQNVYASGKEARDSVGVDWDTFQQFEGHQSSLFSAQIYWQRNSPDFLDSTKSGIINNSDVGGGGSSGINVSTFLELTDVFETTYIGQARRMFSVNDVEDGVEFRDQPVTWRGDWLQTLYEANDMVRAGDWTTIANKDTEDEAAPIALGDPAYIYQGTGMIETSASAKQLTFGAQYTFTDDYWLDGFRIKGIAGTHYLILEVIDPLGANEVRFVGDYTAFENGWREFGLVPRPKPAGTIGRILAIATNTGIAPVDISVNYNYQTPAQTTIPTLQGEAYQANQSKSLINFYYLDNDGTDRTAVFNALLAGDKITVSDIEWAVQSVVDNTTYFSVTVAPSRQSADVGVVAMTFSTIPSGFISYDVETDYYLTFPNVSGLYGVDIDYNDVALDDNAYGVDVLVQQAYVSPDWDIVAHSGGGGGSGGGDGGGESVWRGENPPVDKAAYPIWFNTARGKTLTWYEDVDSGQWVQDVATTETPILAGQVQKNYIINPSFDINQRQYVNGTVIGWNVYTVDRWFNGDGLAGESFSFADSVCTIGTSAGLSQRVEKVEGVQAGEFFTLSWEGTAVGQIVGGLPQLPSPIIFQVTQADIDAGLLCFIYFSGAGGTVSKPKLEKGITATPFQYPDVGGELAKCQRYYYRAMAGIVYERYGQAIGQTAVQALGTVRLPVTMRTSIPILTSGGINALYNGVALINTTAIGINTGGDNVYSLIINTASGLAAGQYYEFLNNNDVNAWIAFDAEIY